jgi:MraZ protein
LALYAEKYYERLRAELPEDDALSDDAYAFRQFEYSQSALLDPDAQGRILLPERLLKRAGLDKEVVLIAVRDHLELWRRDDFEQFEESMWPRYPEQRARALDEMKQLAPGISPVATQSAGQVG